MAKPISRLHFCQLIALASAAIPAPINVTLRSENFQHVLSWSSGDPSIVPTFYTVEYVNVHDPPRNFQKAKNCYNTSDLTCDLTNELTEDFGLYIMTVKSLSAVGESAVSSTELTPAKNTVLGPPIVHISPCNSCIDVTIQPPVSYLKSQDKTTFRSLFSVYSMLKYTITLEGPGEFQSELDKDAQEENFKTVIDDLLPKTNYCISVVVSATMNINPLRKPSALKCVVTGISSSIADYSTLAVLFGVFPLGILLLLVVLHQAGIIFFKRTPLPKALNNIPNSEYAFSEHKWTLLSEQVCPVYIIFKEKKKKVMENSEEEDDSDVEVICEGYTFRISGNTNDHSDRDSSDNSNLHTFTDPLLNDTSGQEKQTLDTEAIESEDHQSTIEDESGSSKLMTPLMDVGCSSAPLDNSGTFNVNLASVLLGDLEKPWKEDVTSHIHSQGDQDSSTSPQNSSSPLIAFDINLLMDAIGVETLESLDVSEECYSNEALLTDESDDSDDNQVSEYMRR